MNPSDKNQTTVVRTERGLSVTGTRITLYQIMDYIKNGWTPILIQKWLNFNDKQMADVVEYINIHQDKVEAEYQLVLREAEAERKYWEEYNRERLAGIAALPPKPGREAVRAKIKARKAELGMI